MLKCSVVIDLGFGDAGKGLTTNFLASQQPNKSLVIRFSGGHQVGHTVKNDTHTHTFSNFGAGTLQGVPTYYSQHTTLFPPGILEEGNYLKNYKPKLYVHPLAMITTMYDIAYNRAIEKQNLHGSCGLGFGATIARNKEEVCFFANDLKFSWITQQRLISIKNYYNNILSKQSKDIQDYYYKELENYDENYFIETCTAIQQFYSITFLSKLKSAFKHFIFEGSQGVLLDTHYGFYPHTTWSSTTSKNALQLIKKEIGANINITLYYITRCYQNRHGNGPMSNTKPIRLINNDNETNVTNEFQGDFRTQVLDVQLLNYALSCDAIYHQNFKIKKNLMITCLDQYPNFSVKELLLNTSINFNTIYGSYGSLLEDIKLLKNNVS